MLGALGFGCGREREREREREEAPRALCATPSAQTPGSVGVCDQGGFRRGPRGLRPLDPRTPSASFSRLRHLGWPRPASQAEDYVLVLQSGSSACFAGRRGAPVDARHRATEGGARRPSRSEGPRRPPGGGPLPAQLGASYRLPVYPLLQVMSLRMVKKSSLSWRLSPRRWRSSRCSRLSLSPQPQPQLHRA